MTAHLQFANGLISGEGRDKDGRFFVKGCFWVATSEVALTKKYRFHSVALRGSWNGSYIEGTAVYRFLFLREEGNFELWPEVDESDLSLRVLFGEAVS